MLTSTEYMMVWGSYGVAAMVMLVLAFKITRGLGPQLRGLLRALVCVILFTPWFIDDEQRLMAPAFIVLLFDSLIKEQVDYMRALMPLMVSGFIATLFLIVHYFIFARAGKEPE